MGDLVLTIQSTPVPVILVIAGLLFIFLALGGNISAGSIPSKSKKVFGALGGVFLLVGISLYAFPTAADKNSQYSPTPIPTNTSINIIYTLKEAKSGDFYTLNGANFVLRNDDVLAVSGSYAQGTYLVQPVPNNFRATIQFKTEHSDDQFILGLSDGKEMRPNYHFVMSSRNIWFKQQFDFDVENWDKIIQDTQKESFLIKPNVTYEVVVERNKGGVNISINNVSVFALGAQDVQDIGKFNYLYLTGAKQQQILIESLVVENLK